MYKYQLICKYTRNMNNYENTQYELYIIQDIIYYITGHDRRTEAQAIEIVRHHEGAALDLFPPRDRCPPVDVLHLLHRQPRDGIQVLSAVSYSCS